MRVKKYLLLLFSIVAVNFLFGQTPGIRYFKIEHDSKPVTISTLFKNNQGYIYAGTSNGLYKFDGLNFSLIPFQNLSPLLPCQAGFLRAQSLRNLYKHLHHGRDLAA